MIKTKNDLRFYLKADRMMNTGSFSPSIPNRLYEFLGGSSIIRYLRHLRKCEYYFSHNKFVYFYHRLRYQSLGRQLGFSIGLFTLGYGVVIPHFGTIVIGNPSKIGNYAVLHTSTCITGNNKNIGEGLYLSTGVKITSPINLGKNISIGANSVVNKSFLKDNIMIGGMPAHYIKDTDAWYKRDGEMYHKRYLACEELKTHYKNLLSF